jgi:hypothetical protein
MQGVMTALIASLHLVEYERRVFSPHRYVASQVAGMRFWQPFNVIGDIGWFRAHPGRWNVYRSLWKPDFRRWAYYAVWDGEPALDTFLTGSEAGREWLAAGETCHFWLRPNRVRGPWQGAQLLRGSEGARPAQGPIAYLTRADMSPRGALAFWRSAAPHLSYHLPDRDEMPLALALADFSYLRLVAFSLWRTQEVAFRFAYREQGHREAVERVRQSQRDVVERFSAASFEPYRSEGAWQGRTVLA